MFASKILTVDQAEDKHVWVLFYRGGGCLGVYSSEIELRKGVDYWMKESPNNTLTYEEWDLNYAPEPNSWEWAYIAPDSSVEDLGSGGGAVPKQFWWGRNLVTTIWEGIPGYGHVE